jgi:hypothetical protein
MIEGQGRRGNGNTALPLYTCNNLDTPSTDAAMGAPSPPWRHRYARRGNVGAWKV